MKARRVTGLDPSDSLRANAASIVSTRLDELRNLAPDALAPEASGAQHDTRIAAKRLRYVLEILGPCGGEAADAARAACKRLQSILGDLHDCDLLLERTAGVESAAVLLHERRERLHHRFAELWQGEVSKGTWAAL